MVLFVTGSSRQSVSTLPELGEPVDMNGIDKGVEIHVEAEKQGYFMKIIVIFLFILFYVVYSNAVN